MKKLAVFIGIISAVLYAQYSYALNVSAEEVTTINTPESSGGYQIGKSVSSTVGFHGAVPSDQRSGSAQVAVSPTTSVSGSQGLASAVRVDASISLLNEIRAVLVEKGLMKGSE